MKNCSRTYICYSRELGYTTSPSLVRDGGAAHFAKCISLIKTRSPHTSVEVLTPDFLRKGDVFQLIVNEKPDVFNHNIETVPSLYTKIRPGANYYNSLNLLHKVKLQDNSIFTKSGIMLGLGEKTRSATSNVRFKSCSS